MTMTLRIGALSLFFIHAIAYGQVEISDNLTMTLRRSSAAELLEKPARVSYTNPSEGDTTYTVDAAAALNYAVGDYSDLGITVETHKNTAVGKEQNKSIVGVVARSIIYLDAERNSLMPELIVADEHDVKARSRGVLTKAALRARWKALGIGDYLGPKSFLFWYEPTIGYQRSDIRRSDVGRGHVNRLTTSVSAAAFPFSTETLGWMLSFTVIYWRDFAESENLDDGRDKHYYRVASISYRFTENFSVGFNRVSGDNPLEGLPLQKYTQLSFEVKF